MNILEIIIIILTAAFAFSGYRKGFVRKLASLLSLVVSVVLVSVCLPYVTSFLQNQTPVYDYIVKQCREVVESQISGVPGFGNTETDALNTYRSMNLEDNSFLQSDLIENLPLPRVFREQLQNNNNEEGYRNLGVMTFQEYVVHFSATVILNVISFIVALLLVQIALRTVIAALDILAHIPVLGGINRLAGLLLGVLQALFLLWIFFMVVSAASSTGTGLYLLSMVQESRFLSYLYDSNFFMQIVMQTVAMFI